MTDWAQLHWQHDSTNPVFVCMYMIMQFKSYGTRHPQCKDNYIITLVVGEQFFHLTSNQTLQHLEKVHEHSDYTVTITDEHLLFRIII